MTTMDEWNEKQHEREKEQLKTEKFVRQHCAQCDKAMGWIALHFITSAVLCNACFFERPVDVCYHCNIKHEHKFNKINDDRYIHHDCEVFLMNKFAQRVFSQIQKSYQSSSFLYTAIL